MRHVYECHLRWADLDSLGHINNVVYVDYLQEARVSLMRALLGERPDDLGEGVVVVRHEVTYLAPLTFGFAPVSIECWVTEVRAATFTMAYEVFHEDDDGTRTVYLRATTVLTPYVFAHERPRRLTAEEKVALAPYVEEPFGAGTTRIPPLERAGAHRFPLYVRFSDVDVYRHVNNVKYFEYLQEARVRQTAELLRGRDVGRPSFVVAQTDVDYRVPILLRHEPYDVWSAIIAVGTRSMTIESEIADGEQVLARARVTVVFFDPVTQR
ncbi:acyl-CoA thioesterase, partial [Nocardioides sp.]|uniref:acyl-CoA thioesterase n=1 Tax=Nocardioides sp. TaxID=35761 RepID=UPI002B279128